MSIECPLCVRTICAYHGTGHNVEGSGAFLVNGSVTCCAPVWSQELPLKPSSSLLCVSSHHDGTHCKTTPSLPCALALPESATVPSDKPLLHQVATRSIRVPRRCPSHSQLLQGAPRHAKAAGTRFIDVLWCQPSPTQLLRGSS